MLPSKRLLSIDDEEDITTIIKMTLELVPGWTVFTANSGHQGIEQAQRQPLDVILLDGHMPEMDGLTTLYRLRQQTRTRHIPVVFLTANPEPFLRLPKAKLGVKGVLPKPFDPMTLTQQIAQLVGWPE